MSGDLHKGQGQPSDDPEADHKEVVLQPLGRIRSRLNLNSVSCPNLNLSGATSPRRSAVSLKHHFSILSNLVTKILKAALKVHKIVKYQYYAEKTRWHGLYFSHGCDFFPCIVPHCSQCTCFEIDNLKLP